MMENSNASAVAIATAAATCGFCLGWFVRGRFARSKVKNLLSSEESGSEEDCDDCEEVEDSEDDEGSFSSDSGNFKLVIVVRNDLKMGKGKIAAQVGHASILAYKQASRRGNLLKQWQNSGQAKVVVKVDDEPLLYGLANQARDVGLLTSIIRDAGRTQIQSGSTTVLGVGPGPDHLVDQITGHLKLC